MATTQQTTGDLSTVKRWEQKMLIDSYKETIFARTIQEGAVQQARELDGNNPGDRSRISYVQKLTGIGTFEGGTLQGNTEALVKDTHDLLIGLFRHGVNNPNADTIEQHRTYIDFMKSTTTLLREYHGTRMDASWLQQLAGAKQTSIAIEGATYTGTDRDAVTGFNPITAPTTNRILRAGVAATDQALISSETMTVDILDEILIRITQSVPTFKTLPNKGFMCIMSPQQFLDIERDSAGSIQMLRDIIRPMTEGTGNSSLINDNKLMVNRPQARYRNIDIYTSPNVSFGENSSTAASIPTVRRAVLLGSHAGTFGSKFGSIRGGNAPFKLFEQLTDFDYFKALEARVIYGMNKIVLQGEDYGSFVISTHSAL